jgi:hypothetical protein
MTWPKILRVLLTIATVCVMHAAAAQCGSMCDRLTDRGKTGPTIRTCLPRPVQAASSSEGFRTKVFQSAC